MNIVIGLTADRSYPCAVVYQDHAGEHRWRMYARNKRIVADSGEGYSTRSGAKRALKRLFDLCRKARS